MVTIQRQELLQSIATRIADFREGEIPVSTPQHVERWVCQFDASEQDVILHEMDHLLRTQYLSSHSVNSSVQQLVSSVRVFGSDPKRGISQTKFLKIARKGSSQVKLLEVVDKNLQKMHGISVDSCGTNPAAYFYLDDCLFSGNTALHDLKGWLPKAKKGSTLHVLFLKAYDQGLNYLQSRLQPIVDQYGVQIRYWIGQKLQNDRYNPIATFDCYWPIEFVGDSRMDSYLLEFQTRCQQKGISVPVFRPRVSAQVDRIFSSPSSRAVIERAFLTAGLHITSLPSDAKLEMRPLGYEKLESLGFGTTIVTYQNIPNNAPLALWWGDPEAPSSHVLSRWYPLFRRRAN